MDKNYVINKAAIEKVHEAMKARGLRLALAESCTGGYISHLITSIPGASEYLVSSIVAYTAHAKQDLLKLDSHALRHGTISPECAEAMALGAINASSEADTALSITGNLGPDPMEEKPVGLVYAAVCLGGKCQGRRFELSGSRDKIKQDAARLALEFLYETIIK